MLTCVRCANNNTHSRPTLIIWQEGGGRQFFNVKVRAGSSAANDRIEGLRHELRTELPGENVNVTAESGNIFLRGTVKDLTSSDRAAKIASTGGKVVNLLYVKVPPADKQILLKVRFASFDRTRSRQLGANLFSTGATNTIGSITTQQFTPPTISGTSFSLSSLLASRLPPRSVRWTLPMACPSQDLLFLPSISEE